MTQRINQPIIWSTSFSDWETWNGNLVLYYGEETIPYSDDWVMVARNVVQLPTFSSYSPPNPEDFSMWQDWADAFTISVNGPTS